MGHCEIAPETGVGLQQACGPNAQFLLSDLAPLQNKTPLLPSKFAYKRADTSISCLTEHTSPSLGTPHRAH
jgi:hypothetical protein